MTLLARKKVVQVKVEAAKGTEETTGLNDALVFDPAINCTGEFIERRGSGLYLGNSEQGVIGLGVGTFTCGLELRGNGTNGMDLAVAAFLQGCGFSVAAEVYSMESSAASHKTVTIVVYEDGIKKVLYGAMGILNLEGETGARCMANVEFRGIYKAVADAALPAFTPNTTLPPVMQNGTFTIGAVAKKVSRFGLNMGTTLADDLDINATEGLACALISDFDPQVSFDLKKELVATYDVFGIWKASTTAALSLVIGSGAGEEITISCPAMQYREISEGDRDGIMIWDATGSCVHSSGDDAVSIAVATT